MKRISMLIMCFLLLCLLIVGCKGKKVEKMAVNDVKKEVEKVKKEGNLEKKEKSEEVKVVDFGKIVEIEVEGVEGKEVEFARIRDQTGEVVRVKNGKILLKERERGREMEYKKDSLHKEDAWKIESKKDKQNRMQSTEKEVSEVGIRGLWWWVLGAGIIVLGLVLVRWR